jgi:hypothetical protein
MSVSVTVAGGDDIAARLADFTTGSILFVCDFAIRNSSLVRAASTSTQKISPQRRRHRSATSAQTFRTGHRSRARIHHVRGT